MKLLIVPARTGAQWVREGIRLFFRQPLAFAGLFFMFIALSTVASLLPVIGDAIALALVPAFTVGMMHASREVHEGRFPMPVVLAAAFRQSPAKTRSMLILGGLYALAVMLIIAVSAFMDDGKLSELLTKHGGRISAEMMADPEMQEAARASMHQMALASLLYLPVSILFWHAPALVHWHNVPVIKSLFFSAVGVLRNTKAYLIYGIGWATVTMVAWLLLLVIAGLLGSVGLAISGMFPVSLVIATMLSASLWATFRDSFSAEADEATAPPP